MKQNDTVFQSFSLQTDSSKFCARSRNLLLLRAPSDYATVTMNDMIRKITDDTDANCRSDNMSRTGAKFSNQTHRDVDPMLTTFYRSLQSSKRTKVF